MFYPFQFLNRSREIKQISAMVVLNRPNPGGSWQSDRALPKSRKP